jgi:predicted dehydrogenase
MEALWIRFFPLMAELRKQLHEQRVIGDIVRVESYNGMAFAFDAQHRLWNPGACAQGGARKGTSVGADAASCAQSWEAARSSTWASTASPGRW